MTAPTARLSVRAASKTFTAQRVLKNVDLDVGAGEVHALVGHNGSGKSTLIKLLAGYHRPDPGAEARVDEQPFELGSALAAEQAGLRFVHQDLGLVETLNVVDNLFLGAAFPTFRGGRIDWRAAQRETSRVLGLLGFDLDPSTPVRALSPTQKTGVAIARAIRSRDVESRVVVLDEPTAALPAREVEVLFRLIRALQGQGLGILFVSHHLEEVFALAGRVTVLRDGVRVTTSPVGELDERRLIELMVGEELAASVRSARHLTSPGPTTLEVANLRGATLADVSFSVRAGEIVGVAGVDGSGREALGGALFGAVDRRGDVVLEGRPLPALRPDVAVERGVGFVPAERSRDGALERMSVANNLTAARVPTRLAGLLLAHGRERSEAERWIDQLGVRPPRPDAAIDALSGGNQQKVMLARWLRMQPKLLILDEPTKGVDVGAVAAIWKLAGEAADSGAAVVACCSDTEELVANCSRVVVIRRGRVAAELAGDDLDAGRIDALALMNTEGGAP